MSDWITSTPKDLLLERVEFHAQMRHNLVSAINKYHASLKSVGEAATHLHKTSEGNEMIGPVSLRDHLLYRLSNIEQDPVFNEALALQWLEEAFHLSHEEFCEIIAETAEKRQMTRVEYLATMPYREYLKTPEWQERRLHILERDGYRCQVCNASNTTFNVHHKTYARRGNEDDSDLITLCQDCHYIFHQNSNLAEED